MTTYDKQVRIYSGTDVERALRCLSQYIVTENAKRTGSNSLTIYTNGSSIAIAIYTTATAYIIRKAE